MSNRFLSLLTSVVLVGLVILAILFVPMEGVSESDPGTQLAHFYSGPDSEQALGSISDANSAISGVLSDSFLLREELTSAPPVRDGYSRPQEVITCLPQ